jgi:Ser/Thr protein kinase RdoA (MazF antagonist)
VQIGDEILLDGGNVTPVVRVGDTVRRIPGPWSPAVHRLLGHLADRGFDGAPRFLGIDAQGREVLSFIAGEVGQYPLPAYMWSDAALTGAARLLRRYHDATLDFVSPSGAHWQMVYPDATQHEIICHNDFAPYNVVYIDAQPHAVIDFDLAGPGPRLWDLAYAAYRFVPLSYAADMRELGLSDLAQQNRRLQLFCTAYGLAAPQGLLDMVAQRIQAMCDLLANRAAAGDPAFRKMVDDGHLAHYQRELAAFREHQPALARQLGW